MSTAQLEAVQSPPAITPEMLAALGGQTSPLSDPLLEEARLGFEELRKKSHEERRGVIAQPVALLEGILREREERRVTLATARMASKMLNIRRVCSIKIRRQVDCGSTLAAVARTLLIVAVMI